jgi:copper(I)-binding protein
MTTMFQVFSSMAHRMHETAMITTLSCLALAIAAAGMASASDAATSATTASATTDAATANPMTPSAAWARATAPGIVTGAIYLTITNTGDIPDDLLSASSPAAATVELHRHLMRADGSMAMVHVDRLAIPAHGAVTCAPGGYHLMLFNLAQPLVAGTHIPLMLTFAHAGTVTTTAVVGDIAAMGFNEASPSATAAAAP